MSTTAHVGDLLRDWRQRRRLSQLELALEAGVSTRHLSFVETGRSRPSADMVLHLAQHLEVPLRERNRLLLAAGYAPVYDERPLDDPEMEPIHAAVRVILDGHDPNPALAVDRGWALVAHNRGAELLMAGLPEELLAPPLNVLRASLHPDGLAPRIVNLGQWKEHVLGRLAREAMITGDPALRTLYQELDAYPVPAADDSDRHAAPGDAAAVPLRLRTPDGGELRFLSTITSFGTPADITVEELSIESFFPADERTAAAIRGSR
jgi:transcriptional regulator with XRE-family HTH domain